MKPGWRITIILPILFVSHMALAAEDTEEESEQRTEQVHQQVDEGGAAIPEKGVKPPRASRKRQAKNQDMVAEEVTEENYPRYARELRMLVQLSKETGIKPRDIAAMLESLRRERDIQDILDGKIDAAKVARAYAAVKGTLPFNPVGNTGRAINKMTGESVVYDKNIANLADQTERSRISQRTASARRDNATTAKTQAQTKQKNAQTKAITSSVPAAAK